MQKLLFIAIFLCSGLSLSAQWGPEIALNGGINEGWLWPRITTVENGTYVIWGNSASNSIHGVTISEGVMSLLLSPIGQVQRCLHSITPYQWSLNPIMPKLDRPMSFCLKMAGEVFRNPRRSLMAMRSYTAFPQSILMIRDFMSVICDFRRISWNRNMTSAISVIPHFWSLTK